MRAVTPSTVLSVFFACGLVLAAGIAPVSVAGDVASANGQPSSSAVSSVSLQSDNTTVTTTVSPSTTASPDSSTTTTTQPDNSTERLEREVEIEFLNCSAFRITGQADELEVSTSAYNPSIDTHLHSYGPINGTEVIDPDSFRDASRGVVTRAVAAYIGPDSNPSARNPNISECMEKIKPDKPTLDVTSVERINESAVSVTFQYHNPNEGKLPNGGGFDGRVTTGRTPDSLRPGSHSFSVVWRPVNESARLTWLVGLVELGYNETVVTMTPPAGSIGDSSDETSSTTTRMATSPTTTPRSTTTTATTSSTSDESSSASGSSSGESAPTTTRQSQQTTTTTPEPTTTILTTEITSATETPTTSRTATPTHSPTPTMASSESANATTNVQADPSEPGGGGMFARIDSSTAIQGGSLAVAMVFAALAFVAWRRR